MAPPPPGPGADAPHLLDPGGLVVIVGAIVLACAGLSLCARSVARFPWGNLLGIDDALALMATIFQVAGLYLVCVSVDDGLGRVARESNSAGEANIERHLLASDIMYLCSISSSRLSAVAFLERLLRNALHRGLQIYLYILAAYCLVACLISILLLRSCGGPGGPSDVDVPSRKIAWITVEILGSVTEFLLSIAVINLVVKIRRVKDRITLAIPFASRWLQLPLVYFHLQSVIRAVETGLSVSRDTRSVIFWQTETGALSVLSSFSIVACGFLRRMQTAMLSYPEGDRPGTQPCDPFVGLNNPRSEAAREARVDLSLSAPASSQGFCDRPDDMSHATDDPSESV